MPGIVAGTDGIPHKNKGRIPPRIIGGIYWISPENFGGIPCGKFQNPAQDPRLDWWDPT